MQPTTYITPRRGGMTVGLLSVWVSLLGLLILSQTPDFGREYTTNTTRWIVGAMMGLALGAAWWAGSFTSSGKRFTARFLGAAIYTVVACLITQQPWFRHGANIGGLMVTQGVVFFALRIPPWRSPTLDICDPPAGPRQYGIGEILVLMTCVALLLAIGQHYDPPIESLLYWSVLTLFWIIAPLITASVARCCLSRRPVQCLFAGVTVLALLSGTSLAMSVAESRFGNSETIESLMPRYASVVIGCAATFAIVAIGGRIDAKRECLTENEDPDGKAAA